MGLYNNVPTFTYVSATGVTVTYNKEVYTVQSFYTNKKYIYWDSDNATVLQASNTMPVRSFKRHLVLINDNGVVKEVPSTHEGFSISYSGDSTEAIKSKIYALYESNKEFGDKFIAIEQDIDGIKQIVGSGGTGGSGGSGDYDDSEIWEKISQIEQTVDNIDLSVKETVKKYNDDKEINKLREDLNGSIIKLNSSLGTFKSEVTGYFKDNEISNEEKLSIETHLQVIENDKVSVDGNVDKVILIVKNNNQTQDLVALNNAKDLLQTAHNNLKNNITNAVIDNIITSTEYTVITDAFAKYTIRLNEIKNTCDDIILLGLGGVIVEELGKISVKTDEIKLSVSKVESSFKSEMNIQKIELENQINDVSTALDSFENTVNTVFKDGIIDEAEKSLLLEKIENIDKEKLDIDTRYNSIYNDDNLSIDIKNDLASKYSQYNEKHIELKEKIEYVILDSMVNDAEKLEINTLFKQYSNTLASVSALLVKAIENISLNNSKKELEKAKEELREEISDVRDSIDEISGVIDGTFQDNVLDEVERRDIQQNIDNLTREKIDIDNTYNNMYSSEYLSEEDKNNFKLVYNEYISAFNSVINVSTNILNKETLIDDVDRANLNSAIARHIEKLNAFSICANVTMDLIALNKSNKLKSDLEKEISEVDKRVDDALKDISGAIGDGIIDQAEALIIKESLGNIRKESLDIDAKYNIIHKNEYLDGKAKTNLEQAKTEFDNATLNLINIVTSSIEDEKVTDQEMINLENAREVYKNKSASLNTRFQEAIDYIANKQVAKAKEDLKKEIDDLGSVLEELEDTMYGAFQDGILTETEKLSIKQHLLTLASEKSDIDKQYATIFANKYLEGNAKTNLTSSYNNYVSAYNSLISTINGILEKEGLIDSVDRNNLNTAFSQHDSKLGLYTVSATDALDYIANKKISNSEDKINSKISVIEIDLNGITSRVSSVENKATEIDGKVSKQETRLSSAEEKITDKAIINTVSTTIDNKISDATISINDAILNTEHTLNQNIDNAVSDAQNSILQNIADNYATSSDLNILSQTVSSNLTQTDKNIEMQFTTATNYTKEVEGKLQEFENTVGTHIRFSENGIDLGKTNSPFHATLSNEKLAFKQDEEEVAYISNNKMHITNAEILDTLRIGEEQQGFFTWVQGVNGNLSLKWSDK